MIIGSIIQGVFANKAGKEQAKSVQQGIDVTRQNFLDALEMIEPQIRMGDRARSALAYELGIGELPFFTPGDLEDEPSALSVVAIPGGPRYYGLGTGGRTRSMADLYGTPGARPVTDPYSIGGTLGRAYDREGGTPPIVGFDVDKYAVGDQTFLTKEAADDYLAKLIAERDAGRSSEGFEYQGFRKTPGYDFQMQEGKKAIERSAAARGMALSGATLKGLSRYSQGLADQTYGNYLNRLAAMSGAGQTATTNAFGGYQSNSNALSQLYGAQGNARASSYAGMGQAVGSGINNIFSALGTAGGLGWKPFG